MEVEKLKKRIKLLPEKEESKNIFTAIRTTIMWKSDSIISR